MGFSGADLEYRAQLAKAGLNPNGSNPGVDGALLEQANDAQDSEGGGGGGEWESGGITFSLDPDYAGLRVRFGPNPIPHPAAFENGIYFVLPDRT